MSIWMIWLAIAGILVAIEIFSGTFYLLMIAIGLAAGGLTAMAGAHFSVQFIVAGVVGLLVTLILRKSRLFGNPIRSATRRFISISAKHSMSANGKNRMTAITGHESIIVVLPGMSSFCLTASR